jgi:hypothetical protein
MVTTATRAGPSFPTSVPIVATVIPDIGVSLLQWTLLLLPLVFIYPVQLSLFVVVAVVVIVGSLFKEGK